VDKIAKHSKRFEYSGSTPTKAKTFMTTTTKSTCSSPVEESVQSKDIIVQLVICIPLLFLPNQQGGPTFNVNLSTIPLLGTSRLVRKITVRNEMLSIFQSN
jgi:hypothetical protein